MAGDGFRAVGPALEIGVVGCGTVGGAICRLVDEGMAESRVSAVYDTDAAKVQAVVWTLKRRPQAMTLAGVIASSDLIVEATTPEAAPEIVARALEGGKDVLVTNPAGIVGREDFVRMAMERGAAIRLPCDILVGLDGVRAAVGGQIESVALTVAGPASFFAAQPAGSGLGADLASPAEPTQVFRGTGADALQALPELANPIAVLCYAGRGFGQTTVIAVADPGASGLTCRIDACAGEASASSETQIPLPAQGPRSSPLVALSAAAALRRAAESLVVG